MTATRKPQITSAAPGASVEDVLRREAETQNVPPVLMRPHCPDIGLADLPRDRYYSRRVHDLEVRHIITHKVDDDLRFDGKRLDTPHAKAALLQ